MTTPFFNSQDRVMRLMMAAEKWLGTPWRPNSMALGAGVSCHNLPRAIYSAARFADLPDVVNTPAAATADNQMETFLDSRPEFKRLQTADCALETILRPGDLLGFFLPMDNVGSRLRKKTINHLGVLLPAGWFIHTLMKKNTDKDLISVPPWSQILIAAWQPVEHL